MDKNRTKSTQPNTKRDEKRKSGLPGGGTGRIDQVAGSGVYPMSGPHPEGDAPIVTEPAWGQAGRGSAGYEDHGESAIYMVNVHPEKCRDLMTKDPVCCASSESVIEAARLMRRYDIGVIPIVEDVDGKKLIGIITDRDLALDVVAESRDPARTRVDELMTQSPATCNPDDDFEAAISSMERNQVRRVPVCDNAGRIVGIISQADIGSAPKTAELLSAVSSPVV